jgi:hypothetical protein
MTVTTHPEHRYARSAPLSASRIEGREKTQKNKKKKMSFTLFPAKPKRGSASAALPG